MKKIKFFIMSFVFAVCYHMVGSSFFPTDEKTNTLQVPAWYIILIFGLGIGTAYVLYKFKGRGWKEDQKIKTEDDTLAHDIEEWKKEKYSNSNASRPSIILSSENVETELREVDKMDGHRFEYWCADLLRKIGFQNVNVTPGSGDQGVDILAENKGVKYAVQCKCYARDLGNEPIQEVEAGRVFYDCHVGVVMTNRHFTKGAKALAGKTGTLLWDRDFIFKAIKEMVK